MSPENWSRLQTVLHSALLHQGADRNAYLDSDCPPRLRGEVEQLIAAHENTGKLDELAHSVMFPLLSKPAVSELPEASLLPRYEIIEKIGAGGMGVVFKARDTRLGREVVLKFLPPHLSGDELAKKRFLLEAQAAAAMDHPNICTIHEIGEAADGKLYIVMGFYDGETLRQRIARGPLELQQAVSIALDIARGLSRAHERGIVHRDIKPANVIVTRDNIVKILDFGIAKLQDTALTQAGGVVGTFAYMSPEQAFGEQVDARTDIWATGVVLYEMLTGANPFRRDNEQAMILAILTADPEPLASVSQDIPPMIDTIIRRCLSRDKDARFASGEELAAGLSTLQKEIVSAPRARLAPAVGGAASATDSSLTAAGERRQSTVVVSQICDYSEIVERAAPEELEKLNGGLRSAAAEIADEYGGILNQFDEEEFVILFGVLKAHEDDYLRGVRAAIALHEKLRTPVNEAHELSGIHLRLRSGIHSGPVVAQRLRSGDRRYRISGSPLTVANRLASLAPADGILVSPEAQRLIAPFFITEAGAPVTLQADSPASTPYRVIGESGLRSRLEAAQAVGLTPYIGRARELASLGEQLELARGGTGQFAVVIGEAGAGKSRLLFEMQRTLDDADVRVLRGRCEATRSATPYLPFIEALQQALNVPRENRNLPEVHDSVVSAFRAIGVSLEDYLPFLLDLLSVPSNAFPLPKHLQMGDFNAGMAEALTAVITLHAVRNPTLLLLEDWHWADDASRHILRQIADIAPGYPLFVVVSSRPEQALDWGTREHQRLIHLGPASAAESEELLKAALKVSRVSPDLAREVLERAGGNPFFIEELCHALVEGGIARRASGEAVVVDSTGISQLPDTVQAVIGTRIDRLESGARDVLKIASVIGSEFARPVLEQLVKAGVDIPGSLERLRGAGLIHQTSVVPQPAYRFKHMLTQEVAYGMLLEHQRAALHGAAGRAIEQLEPGRTTEHADVLARHFSRAGDWSIAVRYALKAADGAAKLNEFPHALSILDAAREWAGKIGEVDVRTALLTDLLLTQERVCETLGFRERQQALIAELVALLEPAGESEKLAEAYLRQGELCTLLRQFYFADQVLEKSLAISRSCGDSTGERNALRSLGFLNWHEGDNARALILVEQALELDRARGDHEAVEGGLLNLGQIHKSAGEFERAVQRLREALELSTARGDPNRQMYTTGVLGQTYRAMGNMEDALKYLRLANDGSRLQKLPIQRSFHLNALAALMMQLGETDEALKMYEEAVELSRRGGYAPGLAQALRIRGEVLASVGKDSEAVPCLKEAAKLFTQLGDPETEAEVRIRCARVSERLRMWEDALSEWESARALPRERGGVKAELEVVEGIARAARHAGKPREMVINRYGEALELSEAAGDRKRAGALLNTLGILEWERGGDEAAVAHYQAARIIFRELHDDVHQGLILNSLGSTLIRLSRFDEARAILEEARDLNVATGERLLEAHSFSALGDLYTVEGRPDDASAAFESSLSIRSSIGDRRGEGWMSYKLAIAYRARGSLREAEAMIDKAALLAGELQDFPLQRACAELRESSASNH